MIVLFYNYFFLFFCFCLQNIQIFWGFILQAVNSIIPGSLIFRPDTAKTMTRLLKLLAGYNEVTVPVWHRGEQGDDPLLGCKVGGNGDKRFGGEGTYER